MRAPWVFLPSELEMNVPTGDVAASRFIYVCCAPWGRPASFCLVPVKHWWSATCAAGMHLLTPVKKTTKNKTKHRCDKQNQFLATSVMRTRNAMLHPIPTFHDLLGLSALTPVPVCRDTCQTEKDFLSVRSGHIQLDCTDLTLLISQR